jgi:phage-related protein
VPDSRSVLEILVDVKNAQAGARDIRQVGTAAKTTGGQAEQTGKGFGSLAKNLAVAAGGAIAVKKGYDFLKSSATAAAGLAKETAALTRITGMDARSSSAWVSIAKSRGIQTDTLTRSFTIFSKQLRSVEKGGKAATTAFKDLGISADQLKGMKTEDALMATADAFQKLPAGADKAAIAQQLFGRQSQALLPLLNLGQAGLQDQMKTMQKYGLTLDEQGVKKGLELAKSQREMKAATDGLKVSVGTALIPVLTTAASAILPIVTGISQFVQGSGFLQQVLPPVAIAIAAVTAAQIAWNIAMAANPLGLVVIAIAALVAALVAAYKNVTWFRDAVNAAFNGIKTAVGAVVNFIKSNWKTIGLVLLTLTGPVGIVIAAFLKFRNEIGNVVSSVVSKLEDIVNAAKNVAEKVKGALSDVGGAVTSAPGNLLSKINPFAAGGTIGAGGALALVGEAGPELMQLPGGTRITPLQQGTVTPVDVSGFGGGDIHVHVEIDRREIAHAVASQTADDRARR